MNLSLICLLLLFIFGGILDSFINAETYRTHYYGVHSEAEVPIALCWEFSTGNEYNNVIIAPWVIVINDIIQIDITEYNDFNIPENKWFYLLT